MRILCGFQYQKAIARTLVRILTLSYLLSFTFLILFAVEVGEAETSNRSLQLIRGDEYSDWALVDSYWLDADRRAAIFVCEKDNQPIVLIAEKTGEDFTIVARNDTLFRRSILEDKDKLWVGDNWGQPFIWYSGVGVNPADEFYLTIEKNESGVWSISSGYFGDGREDRTHDSISFFVANNGTALGVFETPFPKVYVPLVWDMTLDSFDSQVIRTACQEAVTHKGEPGIIPSTMQPNALPQGSVIAVQDNQSYPVFTGPGEKYLRLVGERETDAAWEGFVSNESWIQVFGQENDWVLIQYNNMQGNYHRGNRFGYIPRSAFAEDVEIPVLTWLPYDADISGALEDDPLVTSGESYEYQKQPCRVLATMGDWLYVEVTDETGTGYRGFLDAALPWNSVEVH